MRIVHHALIAATACLALGACGKQDSTTITTTANGTTSVSGSDTSAAALGFQPGKWETTIQVSDIKMGGKAMGSNPPPQTASMCLTPEQAKKGPGELLKNAKADCTANRSVYTGGKVDVDMTCKTPTGTMTMKSTGTFSATEMTSDTTIDTTGANAMSQKVHTTAKRVGDCTS